MKKAKRNEIIIGIGILIALIAIIFGLGYAMREDMSDPTIDTITVAFEEETETTTILTTTTTTTKLETTTTTTEPTTETKELGIVDENHYYIYLGDFRITGYTHEEGFSYGSPTAWGKKGCRPGICAMNRFEMKELGISYGDYIYVKNIGEFRVEDCTADWIENTVDIWVYSNEEASQLTGHQEVYKIVNA